MSRKSRPVKLNEITEDDVIALSSSLGEPDWLLDRRLEGFKAFADIEWPTVRTEEFRYTDPRRFGLGREVISSAGPTPSRSGGITAGVRDRLGGEAMLVDGRVVRATVCAEAAEQGVVIGDVSALAADRPELVRDVLGTNPMDGRKFAALNLAAFTGAVLVHVPAGVELTDPLAITLLAASEGASLPRVVVHLGANARANVYVDHAGDAEQTVVEVIETVLDQGAAVHVVTAQDWGDRVDHIASHVGIPGDTAEYRHLEVTLGGKTVYVQPDVHLVGRGSHGELLGVYFTDEGQHVEHRSLIRHDGSHSSSEVVYKGALQGKSHATWYGNIRIEKHAKACAADETNRNLILSDGAKADTIPFLEILCSDVASCGHHSSVGQVDELQLFYLTSRGIPREEAAQMLVFGFFSEVTDRIQLPGVTETVLAEIADAIRTGPTALMDQRRR
jgi:Fe-S cluster assembly protein SufD